MNASNEKTSYRQPAPVYLDNAATTAVDELVATTMWPFFTGNFGNPSSLHAFGRDARLALEKARKTIAGLLKVRPQTIVFTSGGTESNNTAIHIALRHLGCTHIITSRIEHHAVLRTVQQYAAALGIGISYVRLFDDGAVDQNDFRRVLEAQSAAGHKCFVSLMHANNETGQFTEISWIAGTCRTYGAVFHSDCVQTIGHYPLNLRQTGVHLASASAHKFHGPKGVGFLYIEEGLETGPLLFGGGQERGLRAGTENLPAIVGMARALHLSYERFTADQFHILQFKQLLAGRLKAAFPGILINSGRFSLYTVLSVSFPKTPASEALTLLLDQKGIAVSGGSACSGGSSHVMDELGRTKAWVTIRFSFSRHNHITEIDTVLDALTEILQPYKTTTSA